MLKHRLLPEASSTSICLDDVYEGLEIFSCGQSFIISEILPYESPLPVKTFSSLRSWFGHNKHCLYPESPHSKDPENWVSLYFSVFIWTV